MMPDNWLSIAQWIMEPILHADEVKAFVSREFRRTDMAITCARCSGHGFVQSDPCWECDGTGEVMACRAHAEAHKEILEEGKSHA